MNHTAKKRSLLDLQKRHKTGIAGKSALSQQSYLDQSLICLDFCCFCGLLTLVFSCPRRLRELPAHPHNHSAGSITMAIEETPAITATAVAYGTFSPPEGEDFSTGICDLFLDDERRSDCCAVAFCGVLVHDRNRYFVSYNSPTVPWWRRLLIHVGIPGALLVLIHRCKSLREQVIHDAECLAIFPDDGSGPHWELLNVTARGVTMADPKLSEEQEEEMAASAFAITVFRFVLFVWVLVLLLRAARHRLKFRRHLLDTITESGPRNRRIESQNKAASGVCGCFYYEKEQRRQLVQSRRSNGGGDLCSFLFGCLETVCCSFLGSCWCQCCGICSAAQEEREIGLIRMKQQQDSSPSNNVGAAPKIDYVTFQPFEEYGAAMDKVREANDRTWSSHFGAQSRLSKYMWRIWCVVLVLLAILALLWAPPHFTFYHFGVVLATFFQAFLIMFLVYWWKHRMDVSLDTVTKCFAAGFLISTQLAMVSETIISALIANVSGFVSIVELGTPGAKWGISILVEAGQAFVVAAGSEELSKYFGFWMVDTPDWSGYKTSEPDTKEQRTLNSRASAITVAMVATATGFACCENLEYVFSSTDAKTEILTLAMRSIFPVHPLAAAIQSIGVCRRDIEGERALWKLGRIILPAVLLHGFFDFFLMVSPVIEAMIKSAASSKSDSRDDDHSFQNVTLYNTLLSACNGTITDVWEPVETRTADDDSIAEIVSTATTLLSSLTVLVGVVYFIVQSKRQRTRLEASSASDEREPLIAS